MSEMSDLVVPLPLDTGDPDPAGIDSVLAVEADAPDRRSGAATQSALDASQANALAAERRPTVVVLAGGVGSGKTSVYAAIYERLGRGPFGGWMFAGSQTIPGFEQRCHGWRLGSGALEPFMEHTNAQALPWLHLKLRDVGEKAVSLDLLLGDFDGEWFNQILDGSLAASELPFLFRADHVGVVVDGGSIANATMRAVERQRVEDLLRMLTAPGALADNTVLSILVTKLDVIEASEGEEHEKIENCLTELSSIAGELAGVPVPLLRLAVRSQSSKFPLGHGLETLLEVIALRPKVQIGADPPPFRGASSLGLLQ
jgi:hypothetical protein